MKQNNILRLSAMVFFLLLGGLFAVASQVQYGDTGITHSDSSRKMAFDYDCVVDSGGLGDTTNPAFCVNNQAASSGATFVRKGTYTLNETLEFSSYNALICEPETVIQISSDYTIKSPGGTDRVIIENCQFKNTNASGKGVLYMNASSDWLFTNVHFGEGSGEKTGNFTVVEIAGSSFYNNFENVWIGYKNSTCLKLTTAGNAEPNENSVDNSQFRYCDIGFETNGALSNMMNNNDVFDSTFEGIKQYAIYLSYSQWSTFMGNRYENPDATDQIYAATNDHYTYIIGGTSIQFSAVNASANESFKVFDKFGKMWNVKPQNLEVEGYCNVSTDLSAEGLTITHTGNDQGIYLYSNVGASADEHLLHIHADNAAFDKAPVFIVQDGVSSALYLENNGVYANLGREKTQSTGPFMFFRNTAAADTAGPLMWLEDDNAGNDQDVLYIQSDGTGDGIQITTPVNENAINIPVGNLGLGRGNITIVDQAGGGNGYACFDSNGKLYRSGSACV